MGLVNSFTCLSKYLFIKFLFLPRKYYFFQSKSNLLFATKAWLWEDDLADSIKIYLSLIQNDSLYWSLLNFFIPFLIGSNFPHLLLLDFDVFCYFLFSVSVFSPCSFFLNNHIFFSYSLLSIIIHFIAFFISITQLNKLWYCSNLQW